MDHNPLTVKKCTRCKVEKPLDEFCKRSTLKSGKASSCRKCNSERMKVYLANKGSEILAKRRNITASNSYTCQYCGIIFYGHKRKYCSDNCKYKANTVRKGFSVSGRTRNITLIIDGKKKCTGCGEWVSIDRYRDVKESRMAKYNKYHLCSICESIANRVKRGVHKRKYKERSVPQLIRKAVNSGGESKKILELCGYTIKELRVHLEKQFTKRMNWVEFSNGNIHIDHILPKKCFDLNDSEQWKIYWSLPNLRPYWADENLKKGSKIESLL
jgi:hypothetical protein